VGALTELAAGWVRDAAPAAHQLAGSTATENSGVAVWGALFACGCAILVGAAALAWWQKPSDEPKVPVPRGSSRVRLQSELAEAARDAETLTATAQLANDAAIRARQQSEHAQHVLEVAERAYEDVGRAYEEAAANAARLPDVQASTQVGRDVMRAALYAFRRGDISVEDLHRVSLGVSGWDARHEVAEIELLRLRAQQLEARRAYNMAKTVARLARQAERVAEVAAEALADEAMQAENEVANLRVTTGRRRAQGRKRA